MAELTEEQKAAKAKADADRAAQAQAEADAKAKADEQKAQADTLAALQQKVADLEAQVANANQPADAGFTGQLPYEAYRAQQTMQDIETGRDLKMDETVRGGRYLTDTGKWVDADGKELKG